MARTDYLWRGWSNEELDKKPSFLVSDPGRDSVMLIVSVKEDKQFQLPKVRLYQTPELGCLSE